MKTETATEAETEILEVMAEKLTSILSLADTVKERRGTVNEAIDATNEAIDSMEYWLCEKLDEIGEFMMLLQNALGVVRDKRLG